MDAISEFVVQQPLIVLGLAALALTGIACSIGRGNREPGAAPAHEHTALSALSQPLKTSLQPAQAP